MKKAFTLLELIIVVAILALTAAVGWPALNLYQSSSRLETGAEQAADFLRMARQASWSGLQGTSHGVKLMTNRVVYFSGSSYASRDAAQDRDVFFDKGLGLSWQLIGDGPADEIVFARNTGRPSRTGELVLGLVDGSGRRLALNRWGLVEILP